MLSTYFRCYSGVFVCELFDDFKCVIRICVCVCEYVLVQFSILFFNIIYLTSKFTGNAHTAKKEKEKNHAHPFFL